MPHKTELHLIIMYYFVNMSEESIMLYDEMESDSLSSVVSVHSTVYFHFIQNFNT